MIGYKAWYVFHTCPADIELFLIHDREHKRIIKTYLTRGRNSRTPSEKILALFVDSGLLYCALWVSTFFSTIEVFFLLIRVLLRQSVVMASALTMSIHSASWAESVSIYITDAGLVQIIVCRGLFH
jgi:hypothetical protein